MPTVRPTTSPTTSSLSYVPGPNAATAFSCPQNDSEQNAGVARSSAGVGVEAIHHITGGLRVNRHAAQTGSTFLAVTYSAASATGTKATALAVREQAAGGNLVHQFTFANLGKVVHVLSVPAAQMNTTAAALRLQSGVESVAPTGLRRFTTAAAAYFPNDPYFNGFTSANNATAGQPNAGATYQIGPYEENSLVPGQWDMHAIKLENAFGYSLPGNGTGAPNPNALGSSTVKIAIIDTGEDPNHPELAGKIAYQKCYITNPSGVQTSTNYETDPLGHGTDVTGIAAADMNNSLGFVGAGGNVEIYGYRVFPTPDDNCINETTTDPQCSADTMDISDAIGDAVAQGVNVISMSLGGDDCTSPGTDSDPVEGQAIASAITAGVIVVAASGNSGGSGVAAPGCDAGVLAVGATGLGDGALNGSNTTIGTAAAPVEYVTSYTQFGSPNTIRSASSWGIVAPGGDPTGSGNNSNDNDELHWVDNIWTTTPYELTPTDENYQALYCSDDYPNDTGLTPPLDCRTLIAGTSMATPHVAGAAALILSATGGSGSPYRTPAAMRALLCTTADDLPPSATIQGCGRLNVYTAMAKALGDPSPPTPIP